jgi:uracil phosphoribosyltransferase
MVINLSEKPSLISHTIAQLRDVVLQKDRLRFRVLTERLGEIFAYEISKTLPYVRANVQSPLGVAECSVLGEQPILGTILRAGLPLHYGMLKFFEQADNAFIAAYRKHDPAGGPGFSIDLQYLACAALTGRTLIVADPMLATGRSIGSAELQLRSPRNSKIIICDNSNIAELELRAPSFCHPALGVPVCVWALQGHHRPLYVLTHREIVLRGLTVKG